MMCPDAKVERVYFCPKPVDFRKSIDGPAALAELDISVTELRQTGEEVEVAKVRVNRDNTIICRDISYTVVTGSKVRVKITVPTSGDTVFTPGSITNYHALSPAEDYNRGKHFLFGDSGFASGGDFHHGLIARLNKK